MFLSCFSSLGSCSHHVFSMPLRAPFLRFVGGLGLFSSFSVRRALLWSVDVDGLMLIYACVNMGICLDGRVGHGER
jgi:fluoride ion exporter CrcB/FEX